MAATQAGVIMGTAAYMSPEQAAGKAVDKRSDIWSFGVVLWEMLGGAKLFDGETVSHTLAYVLTASIDFSKVNAPPAIAGLLKRCLDRDPRKRLRDIGEAKLAIEKYLADPQSGTEKTGIAVPPQSESLAASRWLWVAWAVAAVAAVAAAGLALVHFREQPPDRPMVRVDLDLGADVSLSVLNDGDSSVILSPDGTRLVYLAENPPSLFIRKLDKPKSTELPGTRGAVAPFFSPDGQWVGFSVGATLYKISVDGGAAVPLINASLSTHGGSWGEDGSIVLLFGFGKGLVRLSPKGAPADLTQLGSQEIAHAYPSILPGGKAALFATLAVAPQPDTSNIEVVTLADRRRKNLVRGGVSPHYLDSGHLLYANRSTLFAVPFDPEKLETRGAAVPVLDDVTSFIGGNGAQYDVSRNGTLVYRKRGAVTAEAASTIQWVDPAGKRETLLGKPGIYSNLRLSPDGKRLALSVGEVFSRNLWVYDPARDAMTRVIAAPSDAFVWSPDGRYIAFASPGNGISWIRSDGAGQPQPLVQSKDILFPSSFQPDGKRLAYYNLVASQLWTVPLEEQGGQLKAGQPERFLTSAFTDQTPAFSPDGHWLAYRSNESGRGEIYVRAFPPPASGEGGKWQISNSGGTAPIWSPDGRKLIYQSGDQLMAVNYSVKGDAFSADKPRVWIAKLGGTNATLSPDGKRVAIVSRVDSSAAPAPEHEVVLLLNFSDELRRKVPVTAK
jgi:serine/threonine-protein kinase